MCADAKAITKGAKSGADQSKHHGIPKKKLANRLDGLLMLTDSKWPRAPSGKYSLTKVSLCCVNKVCITMVRDIGGTVLIGFSLLAHFRVHCFHRYGPA